MDLFASGVQDLDTHDVQADLLLDITAEEGADSFIDLLATFGLIIKDDTLYFQPRFLTGSTSPDLPFETDPEEGLFAQYAEQWIDLCNCDQSLNQLLTTHFALSQPLDAEELVNLLITYPIFSVKTAHPDGTYDLGIHTGNIENLIETLQPAFLPLFEEIAPLSSEIFDTLRLIPYEDKIELSMINIELDLHITITFSEERLTASIEAEGEHFALMYVTGEEGIKF